MLTMKGTTIVHADHETDFEKLEFDHGIKQINRVPRLV